MTEAEALALIKRKLPPVWADVWTGRAAPRPFRLSSWAKPHTYFLDPAQLVSDSPGLTGLCPLIERNGEAILGWLPDGRFVQFYYEDGRHGDVAITLLGRNYQEFVLSLLLEFEDCGMRDTLVDLAATLRFAYTAALTDVLDREVAGDEALAALRDRIGAEQEGESQT